MVKETWYLDFEGRVTTSLATDSASPQDRYPKAAAATSRRGEWLRWAALLAVLAWLAWETRGVGQALQALVAVHQAQGD